MLNRPPEGSLLVPRSEILARIATLEAQLKQTTPGPAPGPPALSPALDPIIDGIKTLDDLEPAALHAAALTGNNYGSADSYTVARLGQIARCYAEAKNGLPVTLNFTPGNYGNQMATPPGLTRVEAMVLLYLLPRYLAPGAPDPNPGETVTAYLDRVIAAAEAGQDWPLLQRTILAKVQSGGAFNPLMGNQLPPGVQEFLSGLNQEMAGQYTSAVTSYQNSLRTATDMVPARLIGDRLAAIRKDHAADYAEAEKSAARPVTPGNVYLYNPYATRGLPNFPGVPASLPSPTPPTPAAKSTPAAAPPSTHVPAAVPATPAQNTD